MVMRATGLLLLAFSKFQLALERQRGLLGLVLASIHSGTWVGMGLCAAHHQRDGRRMRLPLIYRGHHAFQLLLTE